MVSTPTPPPPAGANANLLGPLKSETFVNDAAQGTLTEDSSGVLAGTAAQTTASFVYEASSQSYTMTVGGVSQTFGPNNINSALTNSAETVYELTSGNTTDSLTVTKPGTSGRFTYEYVGAAFWQSTTTSSGSSGNGAIYALAYGEPTASSAVPTTGTAQYSIDLIGAYSWVNHVQGITGQGTVQVDFAQGALAFSGLLDSGQGSFNGAAILASAGTYSGVMNLDVATVQNGTVNGRLYGPAAQEIGGTFATTDGSNVATGAIIGRQSTATAAPASFASPSGAQIAGADEVSQSGSAAGKLGTMDVALISVGAGYQIGLFSKDYTYSTIPSSPWPSQATGSVADAIGSVTDGAKGMMTIAAGDPYVAAGIYYDKTASTPYYDIVAFGFDTPDAAVPRTGFAGYAVNIEGMLTPYGGQPGQVLGTGVIGVNFATAAVTTYGALNNAVVGSLNGSGTLSSTANAYTGTLSFTGSDTYNGNFQGRLYGPAAQSTGAVFSATSSGGGQFTGVMTGGVNSGLTDPSLTLSTLTATTTFATGEPIIGYVPGISPALQTGGAGGLTQIVYDPATSTYTLSPAFTQYNPAYFTPLNAITLSPASIDSANTNATFTAYTSTGLTARIFNSGASNPVIQLSYVSFADVVEINTSANAVGSYPVEHFLLFGLPTNTLSMPSTGTANYSGVVYGSGGTYNGSQLEAVTGTGQLSVNFGTSALTGSLTIIMTPAGSSSGQSLGTLPFGGTIMGTTFNATFGAGVTAPGNNFVGGGFYGPQAAEAGAWFNVTLPGSSQQPSNTTTVIGVFVGKKG